MKMRRFVALVSMCALLSGCGGGGDGGGGGSLVGATPTPSSPTPSTTPTATCSLRARQDWAAAQLREWYLFPETLPASLNPSGYATVSDYVDALTATARAQRRDRYFTYVTSIAEENAYYSSGQTAGFGVRLDYGTTSLTVMEAFEGAPALAQGIDRGTVITGVGTSAGSVTSIATLYARGGTQAIVDALGPSTAGTTRTLAITAADGSNPRQVAVAKADYELLPVSPRYGVRVLEQDGRRIGYVNLRTFISTAEQPLRDAFARFRAEGVTEIAFDLRYNGGGLVRVAELIGDLMARDRFSSDVQSYTTFRPEKASENSTRFFRPTAQSIAPTRISFIGRGGTASASELVINAFIPYLGSNLALVGTNTYGKPVGQIALDRAACDDRLRVVAFATQNRDRQGDYYDGLATKVANSCAAADNAAIQLGDAREDSVARSIDFIAGRSCTRIAGDGVQGQSARIERPQTLLSPDRPTTAQREVPGLF